MRVDISPQNNTETEGFRLDNAAGTTENKEGMSSFV